MSSQKTTECCWYNIGKLAGFINMMKIEGNIGDDVHDSLAESIKIIERVLPDPY